MTTLVRITGGNVRLVDRLLTQIKRVTTPNKPTEDTTEAVDAAREAPLIDHKPEAEHGH